MFKIVFSIIMKKIAKIWRHWNSDDQLLLNPNLRILLAINLYDKYILLFPVNLLKCLFLIDQSIRIKEKREQKGFDS